MRQRAVPMAVTIVFVWLAMVTFGAVLVETLLIYPNVFHDVPASLGLALEFFAVTGPADVFPPLGAATGVAGLATLVLLRHDRGARPFAAGALGTLALGEFAFSAFYFWPRNEIMFGEGAAERSAEVLRRTAEEFQAGHWLRLLLCGVTAALAFAALMRARALAPASAVAA